MLNRFLQVSAALVQRPLPETGREACTVVWILLLRHKLVVDELQECTIVLLC